MKKTFLAILFLLCTFTVVKAQFVDKSALRDSIATLSLKQLNRWDMMSAAQRLIEENKRLNPVIAEAIVYHVSDKATRSLVADAYRELTDEQLKEVIRFMDSEACERMSSYAISDALSRLLASEMEGYLASVIPWESSFVPLKNKQYSALVGKYLNLACNKSLFDEIAQPLIAKVKEKLGIKDAAKVNEMKKTLRAKFPDYYKTILADYVNQDQLQTVVDFYSQPYMVGVQKNVVPPMRPVLHEAMINPNAFYQRATKELGNLITIKDTSAIARGYIDMLPYIPVYCENVGEKPVATRYVMPPDKGYGKIKKGRFKTTLPQEEHQVVMIEEGCFINEELHGKGSIEFSRGTYRQSEEGCFAFGDLYGDGVKKISFVSNDGWTSTQTISGYFYQGKLNGEMDYREQIDNIPNTGYNDATYTFARLGLDIIYNVGKKETGSLEIHIKGTVIGDKLNGKAEITLSNGDYYKGEFMNGYFLDGTARITNKDQSVYEGDFISGRYEGEGKLTRADGSWDEGVFMFGSFFSGTRRDKRGELHKVQPQRLN